MITASFFFLSLGQLAGGVILGVALWLRHDSQTTELLVVQFEGHQAPGTFYISESHSHCTFPSSRSFTEDLKIIKLNAFVWGKLGVNLT